jgi:uncharacterized membrane protein
MGEINKAAGLSDKQKEWNGWKIVIVLVVVFFAALGITQCSDSSEYTFNGEKYNRIGLTIFFSIVAVAVAIGLIFFRNKKKR